MVIDMPFCSQCGTTFEPGQSFCDNCGSSLNQPAPRNTAPPPPQPTPPAPPPPQAMPPPPPLPVFPPATVPAPAIPPAAPGFVLTPRIIIAIIAAIIIVAAVVLFVLPSGSSSGKQASGAGSSGGSRISAPGTMTQCPASLFLCNGNCVDLQTDSGNCGACGAAVSAGQECRSGQPRAVSSLPTETTTPSATATAATSCPEGLSLCSKTCRDLRSDEQNCGMCGYTCRQGETCSSGECLLTCPAGFFDCEGSCKDLRTDEANCGGCWNKCSQDQICRDGQCAAVTSYLPDTTVVTTLPTAAAPPPPPAPTQTQGCGSGLTICNGVCKNLNTDLNNCGACGTVCPSYVSHGTVSCQSGSCKATCEQDYGNCDGIVSNGCEAYLKRDNNNCGSCGTRCSPPTSCWGSCLIPK